MVGSFSNYWCFRFRHFIQPDSRHLESIERFFLQFDCSRPFCGASARRCRQSRDVYALFGSLQRFERFLMLFLPLEPLAETVHGLCFCCTTPFSAGTASAALFALGASHPLAVAFDSV